MLIFPFAALALLGATAVLAIPAKSLDGSELISANQSCTSDQTECGLRCCPYAHAVCCSGNLQCCQHGQVCIPSAGICIGLVKEENKDLALVSSKATPVENLVTGCPAGFTTCGPNKCCPFPNAVCCSDGKHCCPHGYRCDTHSDLCFKNSDNIYSTLNISRPTAMKVPKPFKNLMKRPYKQCPYIDQQCPSNMVICQNDNGDWSCCPKPVSTEINKNGTNVCCNTRVGYMCCPGACLYFLCCS